MVELSDSQSGVSNQGGREEDEVEGVANIGGAETIADRVMARKRVNYLEFGELL